MISVEISNPILWRKLLINLLVLNYSLRAWHEWFPSLAGVYGKQMKIQTSLYLNLNFCFNLKLINELYCYPKLIPTILYTRSAPRVVRSENSGAERVFVLLGDFGRSDPALHINSINLYHLDRTSDRPFLEIPTDLSPLKFPSDPIWSDSYI